jgi:thiamine-phosphate pyrophosphorylase
MILCLVTDRQRLTSPATTLADARHCLAAQARHAVDAGIDLIQIRERDLDARNLAALTRDLVALTRGSATRLVVNDRLDVALACGADGVHLRADSIPVAAARRLAPAGFLIGRSLHSVGEAAEAAGADYVIAGTVFPTVSKPEVRGHLGVGGLRAIVQAVAAPVLAIGGVGEEECDRVAAAGAAGVAAIGLFLAAGAESSRDHEPACRATALASVVKRARERFDRVGGGP